MTLDEAIDQARRRSTEMAMITTVTLSLDAAQLLLAEIDRLRMMQSNQRVSDVPQVGFGIKKP